MSPAPSVSVRIASACDRRRASVSATVDFCMAMLAVAQPCASASDDTPSMAFARRINGQREHQCPRR